MTEEILSSTGTNRTAFIPKMSIAGFATGPATREALKVALDDRVMVRAKTELREGGIASAITLYRETPTPDILVVESTSDFGVLSDEIDQLANVSGVNTRVILIGTRNDVILFRELMSKGVSDYLVAPVTATDILDSLARLSASGPGRNPARIVAFVGAGGGTGSSTVAQNVALLLSRQPGASTILLDLDLAFGSVALNLDLSPSQTVAEALADAPSLDEKTLDHLLVAHSDQLRVLAAPSNFIDAREYGRQDLLSLLDAARFATRTVVLDLPSAMTTLTQAALDLADQVVITAVPTLVSLRNAQLLAVHCLRSRPSDPPPVLVLNKLGVPNERQLRSGEFERVLSIRPATEIPFLPALFSDAGAKGRLVVETTRRGERVAARLKSVAAAVTPEITPARRRKSDSSLLRRLLRLK